MLSYCKKQSSLIHQLKNYCSMDFKQSFRDTFFCKAHKDTNLLEKHYLITTYSHYTKLSITGQTAKLT